MLRWGEVEFEGAKREGNVKRNERIRKDTVAGGGGCKQVDRQWIGLGTCAPVRCLFESILIIKKRNNEICFIGGEKKSAYGK